VHPCIYIKMNVIKKYDCKFVTNINFAF